MSKFQKTSAVILAVMFVTCVIAAPVFAADDATQAGESKRSLKEDAASVGRGTVTATTATVNYPANLVNDSVNAVGTAAKNTVGIVVDTGKATGETLTGDFKQAPKILTTPVTGTVTTVGTAAKDTVTAPVTAGKQTKEQYRARKEERARKARGGR